jgi:polyhydroxybutyrate depolymerase
VRPATIAAGVALVALAVAGAVFAQAHRTTARQQAALVPACVPPTPGTHRITIPGDSQHPPVSLHVPAKTSTTSRALVLVLPGAGQTAADIAQYTGYSRLADQRGFLVAYPTASGTRPFWNVSGTTPGKPDDVRYLRTAIATLVKVACADPRRVSMTGVSNGGGMTARMACDAADLLAAAAPVAGGYSTLPDCRPERPLPILEIHGEKDTVVPYAGKGPTHAGAVGDWLRDWLSHDHCTTAAHRTAPAPRVQQLRWTCPQGRIVQHERVLDAQHGWPGEDSLRPFSSTLTTFRFLTAFTRDD